MYDPIKCPLCGKEIGDLITDSITHVKGLGAVRNCSQKFDYRKASHVFWEAGRKSGRLCRKCAVKNFPEHKLYRIAFNYHGKTQYAYGGIDGSTMYRSKEKAESNALIFNKRNPGSSYRVEEFKI